MKKIYITIAFALFITLYGQKKDYKAEYENITKELSAKNEELKKKEKEVELLKNKSGVSSSNKDADQRLQKIVQDNNTVFFNEIFENKYKKNIRYFLDTGLGNKEDLYKFENSNVVLANIINDKSKSTEDKDLALMAVNFNETYAALFKIKEKVKDFFSVKYSAENAEKIQSELNLLQTVRFDALDNDKNKMSSEIEVYGKKSCELNLRLNTLKTLAKADNGILKDQYAKIKKEYPFPYLQHVITEMSSNLASYTDDKLPECKTDAEKVSAEKEPKIGKEATQQLSEKK